MTKPIKVPTNRPAIKSIVDPCRYSIKRFLKQQACQSTEEINTGVQLKGNPRTDNEGTYATAEPIGGSATEDLDKSAGAQGHK